MVRSPATFKEKLSAPRETLITAGWHNILLYLVGSVWLVRLYKCRSNCKLRSSNGSLALCVIQKNSWAEAVFRTMVRSPATFKEKLSAPRETLITAGWHDILLCLVGSVWLVRLYKRRSNCKLRSSNGSFKYGINTIVSGYTVQTQSANG